MTMTLFHPVRRSLPGKVMTLHDTRKTTPLAGSNNVNLAANFNKWRVKLLANFVLTSFRLNARLTTRDSLTLTLK
jgi:hypothetical protein